MGRDESCQIRFGHVPIYDDRVPRIWAEVTFHRGALVVRNLDDNWPLELLSSDDEEDQGALPLPMLLQPGSAGAFPVRVFTVRGLGPARTPDGDHYVVHATAVPMVRTTMDPLSEVKSYESAVRSTTQRAIGQAVLRLKARQAGRPTYEQIVIESNFSKRTVRENVGKMAARFVTEGLVPFVEGDDALDRVTMAVSTYPRLVF
jgi:hypothetical protein